MKETKRKTKRLIQTRIVPFVRGERERERERDSVVISDAYVHACIAEECKHPQNKQ